MKTRRFLTTMFCSLMVGMSFTGCGDEFDEFKDLTTTPDDGKQYSLILNEGLWGANNACISGFVYNELENELNGQGNLYLKENQQLMGDVANDMVEEDDQIYVVLHGSKYVAKLNTKCKEEARYTFSKEEGAPRCIAVEDDFAYATQYGGQVTKLNVKDMTVAGTFKGGDNLEGIVEKDSKLYVSNSYKVDGSGNYVYGKEVFVIDAKTMKLEKTINVVDNPTKLYEIDDNIYLISQGNYYDVAGALQVINTQNGTSKVIINDVTKITEGHDNMIYGIRANYNANWELSNSFFIYNPKADEVVETSFLKNAPSSFSSDAIYLLEVDEETGNIYVGTSDYTTNGTIYQFDKNGKLLRQFDSGGINPSAMVFIN